MIKCNFNYKGFELLVHNLHVCDKVQEFTFCLSKLNDAWGYKVLEALQDTTTMTTLRLISSDVSVNGTDSISTALAAIINNSKNLKKLTIVFNALKATASIKILKAISKISFLKQLIYYNSKSSTDELALAITSNPRLEELRLDNNDLQTDVIIKISDAINKLSRLKVFSVTNNGIAASKLAVAINSKQLKSLYIQSNNLLSADITSVGEQLQHINTLTVLAVSYNEITEKASECLASLINANKSLEEIYLNNNSLRTAGITKISEVLKCFTTLKVLNLKCNKFDHEAADDISAIITNNQLLEFINLSENKLQTVGAIEIAKALKSCNA